MPNTTFLLAVALAGAVTVTILIPVLRALDEDRLAAGAQIELVKLLRGAFLSVLLLLAGWGLPHLAPLWAGLIR